MTALSMKNVYFNYGRDEETLTDISLTLQTGGFLVMIGPNGGGKSTVLKIILGLLKPSSGDVKIFDKPIAEALHDVGYVPQDGDRIKNFPVNVIDTVLMGFSRAQLNKKRAIEMIELFGMKGYENSRLNELSTGQRQRVFLARALAPRPKLLVLDEPISGVDPAGQKLVLEILQSKLKETTIIFVSHDLSVIPGIATSVACVNRTLYYHPKGELTETLATHAYGELGALSLVSHTCNCDVPHD